MEILHAALYQMNDFDKNLHKYYEQLIVVRIHRSPLEEN